MIDNDDVIVLSEASVTVVWQAPECVLLRMRRCCCLKFLMHPSGELATPPTASIAPWIFPFLDLHLNSCVMNTPNETRGDDVRKQPLKVCSRAK